MKYLCCCHLLSARGVGSFQNKDLLENFPLATTGLPQPAFTCPNLTIETVEQRCEICSKLTINKPKRRQWRRFGVFIVNFEHISHFCSSVSIVNFKQVNCRLGLRLLRLLTTTYLDCKSVY